MIASKPVGTKAVRHLNPQVEICRLFKNRRESIAVQIWHIIEKHDGAGPQIIGKVSDQLASAVGGHPAVVLRCFRSATRIAGAEHTSEWTSAAEQDRQGTTAKLE